MNKTEHLLRFHRFQRSRENFFAPKINDELHKQYLIVAGHAATLGSSAVNKIDSSGIARIIRQIYIDAATVYGAKIRADFVKEGFRTTNSGLIIIKRASIGFSQRMHDLITAYFQGDILNTSEGITQKTRELITKIFTEGYRVGLSINEIVKQLKDTELSKARARTIARTETTAAANQGALFVANDTGLLYNKTWLATKDKRTRDTHNDHGGIDGHQVGKYDYFVVGGFEMLAPGDKGGARWAAAC